MKDLQFPKRIASAVGCLALTAALAVPVSAAEGTRACTYVPITQDGFVAAALDGVEARYNLSGPTLYCVELVERYYQEVYGLTLRCDEGQVTVLNSDDLYFEPTDDPQPGDILFGSAAARGSGYSHWALVRARGGDSLTLFEQNWSWNGQAGADRVIDFPTDAYQAYTLKSRSGAVIQPRSLAPETPSAWAEPYLQTPARNGIAQLTGGNQAAVTRETFCAMALSVLTRHGVTVPETAAACAAAAQLGLVSSQDGAQLLTRQEAAVITARLITRIGTLPQASAEALSLYRDAASIADWAQDAAASLTACGLMGGTAGSFQPLAGLTCGEAAALLLQVDENPKPAAVQLTGSIEARLDEALACTAGIAAARCAEALLQSRIAR